MTNKKLYQKCQATASFITCALFLNIVFVQPGYTQAQDPGRTYADRQNPKLSKSGPIYADPNVYVYTAEFAKRFQMPDAWISTELKGVDAVAWRLMPSYKECGWGGDPKTCSDSVQCEVDLYFDHQRQPLPWDRQRPERYISPFESSVGFLANYPRIDAVNHPNYPVALRNRRVPEREGDFFLAKGSPFIDRRSGRGLTIQYFSSLAERSGWGFVNMLTYDKEVFPGMALVTTQEPACDGVIAAYVFANDYVRPPLDTKDKAVVHTVLLPQSWRERVALAAKDYQERRDAFFKSEGEKAINALHEKSAQ